MALPGGEVTTVEQISTFRLPEESSVWLAYHKGRAGAGGGRGAGGRGAGAGGRAGGGGRSWGRSATGRGANAGAHGGRQHARRARSRLSAEGSRQ